MPQVFYIEGYIEYSHNRRPMRKRVWLTAPYSTTDQINRDESKMSWIASYHMDGKKTGAEIKMVEIDFAKAIGGKY